MLRSLTHDHRRDLPDSLQILFLVQLSPQQSADAFRHSCRAILPQQPVFPNLMLAGVTSVRCSQNLSGEASDVIAV